MTARFFRTTLRTLHLLAFGAYYGGQVFDVAAPRLAPALAAVATTGVVFAAFETWQAPVFVVQLRGLAVLIKLALLLMTPFVGDYQLIPLTAVVVIGATASHMPSRFRYYSVVHRAVVSSNEKG